MIFARRTEKYRRQDYRTSEDVSSEFKINQVLDKKHLESFEMWRWRRMEISWTDRVRNEEVLLRVNEQRNILHAIRKRKANWIGKILFSWVQKFPA